MEKFPNYTIQIFQWKKIDDGFFLHRDNESYVSSIAKALNKSENIQFNGKNEWEGGYLRGEIVSSLACMARY